MRIPRVHAVGQTLVIPWLGAHIGPVVISEIILFSYWLCVRLFGKKEKWTEEY